MSSSERLKSLKFRTFEELLNEVRIDMPAYSQDNSIQPAELIKIAQECNYDLGLKIHQTKETVLDVDCGAVKLPADFHIMNFALSCHSWKRAYQDYPYPTGYGIDILIPAPSGTTCPCWTVTAQGAQCPVISCDGTSTIVYFPPNDDGSPKVTKICAILVDTAHSGGGPISAHITDTCTENSSGIFACPGCGCDDGAGTDCNALVTNNFTNKVYTSCNQSTAEVVIMQQRSSGIQEYSQFEYVQFVPSRHASAFSTNNQFRDHCFQAQIKNGFIYIGGHPRYSKCDKLYINYQGAMEDEDGNLLVLDHPKINKYYEYAIKVAILENLYINGEPDIERRLAKLEERFLQAKATALSISNTPELYEMQQAYKLFRREMEYKYFSPWNKYFGNIPGLLSSNTFYI